MSENKIENIYKDEVPVQDGTSKFGEGMPFEERKVHASFEILEILNKWNMDLAVGELEGLPAVQLVNKLA